MAAFVPTRRSRLRGGALFATATVLVGLVAFERSAAACGAAYPGGPVMCDFPRAKEGTEGARLVERPVARVSTSYSYTNTTLSLMGTDGAASRHADLVRHAVFGAVEIPLSRAPTSTFAVQVGAGGIAGGELRHAAGTESMGPGFSAFIGLASRLVDAKKYTPFVHLTLTLSGSHVATRTSASLIPNAPRADERYTAFDFRAGAIVGKTFGGIFTPYAAARLFGGPVFWTLQEKSFLGTDIYKYQLGGGVSLALFDRKVDVFAEGIGLGERGVAAGVGTTFF